MIGLLLQHRHGPGHPGPPGVPIDGPIVWVLLLTAIAVAYYFYTKKNEDIKPK